MCAPLNKFIYCESRKLNIVTLSILDLQIIRSGIILIEVK